jgi:ceramide synthetase
LSKLNQKRYSESLWKGLFYTFTWFYCLYLLKYRYNYFDEPYFIWDGKLNLHLKKKKFIFVCNLDWSSGMIIPFDIKLIYIIECGFYIHSIYATCYMDHKRKDFFIMIIHHIVTITLIAVSYAIR